MPAILAFAVGAAFLAFMCWLYHDERRQRRQRDLRMAELGLEQALVTLPNGQPKVIWQTRRGALSEDLVRRRAKAIVARMDLRALGDPRSAKV